MNFGVILSLLILASGVGLQVFVPLHVIDLGGFSLFGIPPEISGVFIGTVLVLAGLLMHYFTYYKGYAQRLDALPSGKKGGHKS